MSVWRCVCTCRKCHQNILATIENMVGENTFNEVKSLCLPFVQICSTPKSLSLCSHWLCFISSPAGEVSRSHSLTAWAWESEPSLTRGPVLIWLLLLCLEPCSSHHCGKDQGLSSAQEGWIEVVDASGRAEAGIGSTPHGEGLGRNNFKLSKVHVISKSIAVALAVISSCNSRKFYKAESSSLLISGLRRHVFVDTCKTSTKTVWDQKPERKGTKVYTLPRGSLLGHKNAVY